MKWGGKQQVKWALVPHECSQCEQWVWLEKYYRESSIRRYCLACDVARELERQARADELELYKSQSQSQLIPLTTSIYPGYTITNTSNLNKIGGK